MDMSALSKMTFADIDPERLPDSEDISINMELSPEERIKQYIEDSVNPYFLKVGNVVIKLKFSEKESDQFFSERFCDLLITQIRQSK